MRRVQLARARRPESFARVVRVPDVQVADLRAFGRRYAADVALWHGPGKAGADGDGVGLEEGAGGGGGGCVGEAGGEVGRGAEVGGFVGWGGDGGGHGF